MALVYNPTAPPHHRPRDLARTLGDLSGKIVGFIDNAKPNFHFLVDDLAELLIANHGVKAVMKRAKKCGGSQSSAPAKSCVSRQARRSHAGRTTCRFSSPRWKRSPRRNSTCRSYSPPPIKDSADLLRVIADTLAHAPSNDYCIGGEPWIIISPEHAHILSRDGLGKAEVRRRLWELSRMPARRMAVKDFERTQRARRDELGEIGPDTLLPISTRPELIGLVVAGGPGTHSVYVPSFGDTRSVTRPIDQPPAAR